MRRIFSILASVAILGGASAIAVSAASPVAAQTGYPPGPCTTVSGGQDAGSQLLGSTFTITLAPVCAWDPGTPVSLTANGQGAGTKTADASGFVTATVAISGSPGNVVLNINPAVTGQCGANSVVGSGHSSVAGGAVTQSVLFNIACPTTTTTSKGGLAFTGANLLRWGAVAAVLVGLGSFLVVARRRRSSTV